MNNSFIWKNEDSETFGIIVESLPPIVKPPIKYETIEIDGRDGDITNILGYKSYIKPLNIAFIEDEDYYYYDYNYIDQISSWLTGEGRIIFSNEPYKYYNGIILDLINFEKAIRFRKATINIKVQPYKYSIDEKKLIKTSNFIYNISNELEQLPIITLTGNGLIHLLINDKEVCQVNIDERITLDSTIQEAYKDNKNNLANRRMLGDFPILKNGLNSVNWFGTGTISQVEVKLRERWL